MNNEFIPPEIVITENNVHQVLNWLHGTIIRASVMLRTGVYDCSLGKHTCCWSRKHGFNMHFHSCCCICKAHAPEE